MNILSLFDGMSCGQQALERANIKFDNYYASEIDKYAIKVTQANYPNTIQLGSVTEIDTSKLPMIDILFGGSPCQSFSFAGKRRGMSTKDNQEILTLEHYLQLKNDEYEFEGQSYLFWEYMRILNEVKPKYFLLENVIMGEKWEKILSKTIGVNPIEINSALVSAQNRRRLYWTNIGLEPNGLFGDLESIIQQPKDKGILLKDIIEQEVDDRYYIKNTEKLLRLKDNIIDTNRKSHCFTAGGHLGGNHSDMDLIVHNMMPRSSKSGKGGTGHLTRNDGKTYCLDTGNTNAVEIKCVAMRGRKPENPTSRKSGLPTEQQLEPRTDNKSNCLTSVQKDNLVIQLNLSKESGGCQPYMQNRVYDINGINPALTTLWNGANLIKTKSNIRRLTPLECERLQTVKDNYTIHVSDSQRYKMLGNGWTVDVLSHIFSYINNNL